MKSANASVVILCSALIYTPAFSSDAPTDLAVGRAFPAGTIMPSNNDVMQGKQFLSGDDLFVALTNCRGGARADAGIHITIYSISTLKPSGHFQLPCLRYNDSDSVFSITSDEHYVVVNIRSNHAGEDDQVAQSNKDKWDKGFLNTFIFSRKTLELVRKAHISDWIDFSYLQGPTMVGCTCTELDPMRFYSPYSNDQVCDTYDLPSLRESTIVRPKGEYAYCVAGTPDSMTAAYPDALTAAKGWIGHALPPGLLEDLNDQYEIFSRQPYQHDREWFSLSKDQVMPEGEVPLPLQGFQFERLGQGRWHDLAIVTQQLKGNSLVGLFDMKARRLTPLFQLLRGYEYTHAVIVGNWLIAFNNDAVAAYGMDEPHQLYTYKFDASEKDRNDNGTPRLAGSWIFGHNWMIDTRQLH